MSKKQVTKTAEPKVAQTSVRFSKKTMDTVVAIRKMLGVEVTLTALVARGLDLLEESLQKKGSR